MARVGQTVETLRKACHIPRRKLKKGEAPPLPSQLAFKIGSTPVLVEIDQGRVWRVIVEDGPLRTADRLGVGAPLASLLASAPAQAGETEGVLYATTAANCGISFALSYPPRRGEDRDHWTAEALARLPPETKITRVLMSGCKGR